MKKPGLKTEASEQEAIIQWASIMAKRPRYWMLGRLLYHTPNGGSRDVREAQHLKRMGVRRGVPDLCLPYPSRGYNGLYIELKVGKNRLTKEQRQFLTDLNKVGYRAVVCYGADEAIAEIERYLK